MRAWLLETLILAVGLVGLLITLFGMRRCRRLRLRAMRERTEREFASRRGLAVACLLPALLAVCGCASGPVEVSDGLASRVVTPSRRRANEFWAKQQQRPVSSVRVEVNEPG